MGLISSILFGTFLLLFGFWAFKTRSWRDFKPSFFGGGDGECSGHETRGAIERGKVGRVDTRAVTKRQVNHSNVTWLQVIRAVLQGCFVMA